MVNPISITRTMNGKEESVIVDGNCFNTHPKMTEDQLNVAAESLSSILLAGDRRVMKTVDEWVAALRLRDVADLECVAVHLSQTIPGVHWDRDGSRWNIYMEE